MTINIGISDEHRNQIHDVLFKILSSYYVLLIKTQNYHWNVQGSSFLTYHQMLEDQYKDLQEAIDTVAERIRTLGHRVEATTQSFYAHSILQDEAKQPTAPEMLTTLLQDRETIIRYLRHTLTDLEQTRDEGTFDMLTGQLRDHEKTAWILRSHF